MREEFLQKGIHRYNSTYRQTVNLKLVNDYLVQLTDKLDFGFGG